MSLRGRWEGLRLDAETILRRAGPAFTKWARAAGPRLAQTAHDWGPRLERMGWALVELTAGPKRAMRQLALAILLQCGVVAWHVLRKGRTSRRSKEEQSLVDALARAPTQDAWGRAAAALDAADGSDAWRARGGSGTRSYMTGRSPAPGGARRWNATRTTVRSESPPRGWSVVALGVGHSPGQSRRSRGPTAISCEKPKIGQPVQPAGWRFFE